MAVNFGPGLHSPVGQRVGRSAYDRDLGRWSRLFVPATLAAAEVGRSHRTLDVATGPGEAAWMALALVGPLGLMVGAEALPFADGSFDSTGHRSRPAPEAFRRPIGRCPSPVAAPSARTCTCGSLGSSPQRGW